MKRSVWMNAWDLYGSSPGEIIGLLRDHHVNACSIGLSYHGGRMLLPRNPHRVVFEQHPGALYFGADTSRFPASLRPAVSPDAQLVSAFLSECAASGFPASAWLVLCHHDLLPAQAPDCAVRNAFGEVYSHTLCPANPQVQEYCVELCRQAARTPGLTALDAEALSFLGYEHGGLHDKRGIPVKNGLDWILSVCCCKTCVIALPGIERELREHAAMRLRDPYRVEFPGLEAEQQILAWREKVQLDLLRAIRDAVYPMPINLRIAQSPKVSGGKSTLPLHRLSGLASEVTFTYFGHSVVAMRDGISQIPDSDLPVNIGFVFHEPDCSSPADVLARAALVAEKTCSGAAFYSLSLAAQPHWTWLKQAIQEKLA